ncbi:MAG: class I SAM-dependent methyltransferase [Holosporales bacterium]|nr:class I SAM-dependent methyltransferase [Holosporales bacterium]
MNLRLLTIPRGEFTCIRTMGYDNVSKPALGLYEKGGDYCRHRALELVREEIGDRPGNVAELGVYKGESARTINYCFPDRKLFLYDIFDFLARDPDTLGNEPPTENYAEVYQNNSSPSLDSTEIIKKGLPHPENCVFRRGYFPETAAPDVDEKFIFVSIDAGSYDTIYKGLEFFYSRLLEGGYLFLGIYNFACENDVDRRCKQALIDAEKAFGPFKKVPLPDWRGTLVIVK